MPVRLKPHHLDALTEPQKALVYTILNRHHPNVPIWAIKVGALFTYLEGDDSLTVRGKKVAKNTLEKLTETI